MLMLKMYKHEEERKVKGGGLWERTKRKKKTKEIDKGRKIRKNRTTMQ